MAGFNMNDLLNAQSKNTERKRPVFEIRTIHIDNIIPSEKNEYGIRDIEELADSIDNVGLLHNLVVEPTEDKDIYRLISGERRYRACTLLVERGNTEYTYLPCKVEKNDNDIISELRLIFANATARELTDYEKTWQAGRLKELLLQLRDSGYKIKGRIREIVAEEMSVSPAQVGRMESINEKLVPELKEQFKEGDIGITKAYELSTLPEAEQKEVVTNNVVAVLVKADSKPKDKQVEVKKAGCDYCLSGKTLLSVENDINNYDVFIRDKKIINAYVHPWTEQENYTKDLGIDFCPKCGEKL